MVASMEINENLDHITKVKWNQKNAIYMSFMMMGNGSIIAQMVPGIKNMQDFIHFARV
jgi:hypothetical protein